MPAQQADVLLLAGISPLIQDVADRTFGWHKKLRKTDEFSSVFHFHCSQRGQLLDISAAPNQTGIARLGLIVPKKILSTAVERNRVKRLLREWFRLHQEKMAGLDIIARLKGKSSAHALDETTLRHDFLSGVATCQACVTSRQAKPNHTD
jgi:ribonuclease P protein component